MGVEQQGSTQRPALWATVPSSSCAFSFTIEKDFLLLGLLHKFFTLSSGILTRLGLQKEPLIGLIPVEIINPSMEGIQGVSDALSDGGPCVDRW